MVELDHLLWAVPDLAAGVAALGERIGVVPATGGVHPGFGTRNALASLGPGVYLEVIAPDPAQPGVSSRFTALVGPTARLATFAVRTEDLDGFARAAEAAGATVGPELPMARTRPDGVRLAWSLRFAEHPAFGPPMPFAIDWRGSPHPSASAPAGSALQRLVARDPDPASLAGVYAALGLAVPVEAGAPGLRAVLRTPRGEVGLGAA